MMESFKRTRGGWVLEGLSQVGAEVWIGLGVFILWLIWLFFAQVSLYEISSHSRIESLERAVTVSTTHTHDKPPTRLQRYHGVAFFSPRAALGRIHQGNPVTIKIEGFPWMEFGTLQGFVETVSSEIQNEQVRVDYSIDSQANRNITLVDGLPATVEIQLEKLTPWAWILRTSGAGRRN